LASNFNNEISNELTDRSESRAADTRAPAVPPNEGPLPSPVPEPLVSEAVIKFRSCRWRRPPDDGVECCGHRDVLPIAGTTSFDAEAWCPDCAFFKLRRTPKKRPEPHRY
jgi:hypothetical protein